MTGFTRALRGEAYLLTRRRGYRWALAAVFLTALLHALGSWILLEMNHRAGGPGPGESGDWNFWPRFASSARAGMFPVELFLVGLIAAAFPRETGTGSVRDPLVRGISRAALVSARSVAALALPLVLGGAAIGAAALGASLCFEAGDVMEEGFAIFDEAEVRTEVMRALGHGFPALLALGALAVFVSAWLARGAVAVATGIAIVLLPGILPGGLSSWAPWMFTSTLPGLGKESYLEKAAEFAAGYADALPRSFESVITAGWIAPWPALLLFLGAAILVFRKRDL